MGRLKTIITSIALAAASPAAADSPPVLFGEPLEYFADCAGRLSAQMEFQWLMSLPEADTTERHRAAVIDILDAIMPPDAGRHVLHRRVSARQAHWALLTAATFKGDGPEAQAAKARAEAQVADCTRMLLT